MTNQGLLRDMQAMASGEQPLVGPVESFVHAGIDLDARVQPSEQVVGALDGTKQPRVFTDERLVSAADPCQSRAVKLARESRGLVVHGPPGTGKSQTITNVIGDHLSRGQRVLFVCEKRTALDVVSNRLEHLGLGRLCALVHDPQRDQRELYRAVRQQLDDLADVTTSDPRAQRRLAKIDEDLQTLHAELTRTHDSLMRVPNDDATGLSFHELVGQWLAIAEDESIKLDAAALADATLPQFEKHEQDLQDVLERSLAVAYATNPWRRAAGIKVEEFVSRPMPEFRAAMGRSLEASIAADATADPDIPPFTEGVDLAAAGPARAELADRLERALKETDAAVCARWGKQPGATAQRALKQLNEAGPSLAAVRSTPLDPNYALVVKSAVPSIASVNTQLATLSAYIDSAKSIFGFFAFGKKSAAAQVLNAYGVTLSKDNATAAHAFLTALRSRLVLQSLHDELSGKAAASGLIEDAVLVELLEKQHRLLAMLHDVRSQPALAGLEEHVLATLSHPVAGESLVRGLGKSPQRALALAKLEASLVATRLFDLRWLASASKETRAGKTAAETVGALNEQLDTLEGVLRTRTGLLNLPPTLAHSADQLVTASVEPEPGFAAMRRVILASEITRRLRSDPQLQNIDGQRMRSSFERYRSLDAQKREIVRDAVLHFWTSKQKERLLATTGTRLSGLGADLRRRLTMRGERAMRLRQVIAVGAGIEGGDPLFDLCPVWMASPETVAQIFAREPMFDVVIFDEASQCRLEEALPALLRGKRVVIAGDPKQLPPTRFFESAVAQSEDEPIETDQQLFEMQQGEIEDLLGAALNLSIQQCYLDVHYRSRNADLIGFSNEHFYGSRLQAIPGHPSNRSRFAPLTLYRADGTYKDGENPKEAERVVQVVKDLLRRAEPPSIGIACFNIDQRDLIVEALDEAAAEDAEFGKKLAESRTRSGAGSFEGLFVKNLENVQGDERDHIIISTTYGPDENGRFYRRFGPLGRAGGGRRLNVLVTRAREEVHIVTSIPAEAYRAVAPVPPGQSPGGAWLLFAYLHYAEQLAAEYEQAQRILEAANAPDRESEGSASAKPQAAEAPAANVYVRKSRWPSPLAASLGQHVATTHHIGSDVHWGNDGFCVDVALHHPARAEDVTVGVLCDTSRFGQAQDPVEWDAFRTAIHESQGWRLHRIWSPSLFRDTEGNVRAILRDAAEIVATEDSKDSIRTSR
jgi:hypothetical protein